MVMYEIETAFVWIQLN